MRAVTTTGSATTMTQARDGTPILLRHWAPADSPWASVVLIHGIAEHSGRYEHVGGWLADAGLDVLGFDLRGFGASGGRRAYVDRWSQIFDDVADRMIGSLAGAGTRPVVLWGHSLGGLIALGYCIADPSRPLPDALVLSAPAIASSTPGWQRVMARVLTRLAPTLPVRNAFDGSVLSTRNTSCSGRRATRAASRSSTAGSWRSRSNSAASTLIGRATTRVVRPRCSTVPAA